MNLYFCSSYMLVRLGQGPSYLLHFSLFRQINFFFSEIRTKCRNTLWAERRIFNIKPNCKVKVKFTLEQDTKAQRGSRDISSTLSLTSALDVVGGQRHVPAALRPGKTRYPLYRRLGWPQGRSERVRKISPPPGIRSLDRPIRSESLILFGF